MKEQATNTVTMDLEYVFNGEDWEPCITFEFEEATREEMEEEAAVRLQMLEKKGFCANEQNKTSKEVFKAQIDEVEAFCNGVVYLVTFGECIDEDNESIFVMNLFPVSPYKHLWEEERKGLLSNRAWVVILGISARSNEAKHAGMTSASFSINYSGWVEIDRYSTDEVFTAKLIPIH